MLENIQEAHRLIERIDDFDERSANLEHTDIGEAWELLYAVREFLARSTSYHWDHAREDIS